MGLIFMCSFTFLSLYKQNKSLSPTQSHIDRKQSYVLHDTVYRIGNRIKAGRYKMTSISYKSNIDLIDENIGTFNIYNNIEKLPTGNDLYWRNKFDSFDISFHKGEQFVINSGEIKLTKINTKCNKNSIDPGIYKIGVNLPQGTFFWVAQYGVGSLDDSYNHIDIDLANDGGNNGFEQNCKVNLVKGDIIYSEIEGSKLNNLY